MKIRREIEIKLFDRYQHSVSSRSSITVLLNKFRVENDLTIRFNFENISFVSRSAAQQLVLEEKLLSNNNIKFQYYNVAPDVNKILELAQYKLVRKTLEITQIKFDSTEELDNFLVAF